MINNDDVSFPVLILFNDDEHCPKNYVEIKEIEYEVIGQFNLEKVAFDIVLFCVKLQKAGIIKFLETKKDGIPAILCLRLLEIAFSRKSCRDAHALAKRERKTVNKMPESIRNILKRKF